jgi:hypothetical protein
MHGHYRIRFTESGIYHKIWSNIEVEAVLLTLLTEVTAYTPGLLYEILWLIGDVSTP